MATDRATKECDANPGRGRCDKRWQIAAVAGLGAVFLATALLFRLWRPHFGQNRVFLVAVFLSAEGLLIILAALKQWRLLAMAGLNFLTAALLTVSFAPWSACPVAYIALVPWGVALWMGRDRKVWSVLLSTLGGLVFWAVNVYWLMWLTRIGYVAGTIYLSAYWALAAWLVGGAVRRRWPMWVWLAVYWVAVEYLRNYIVAFPWFYLAHSQYMHARLIQIADTTGQYGVSVLVAMVNGLSIDAWLTWRDATRPREHRVRRLAIASATTAIVFGCVIGYGHWRIGQDVLRPGPRIVAMQGDVPSTLHEVTVSNERVARRHIEQSRLLEECDLILWPEASLPPGMNTEMLTLDAEQGDIDRLRLIMDLYEGPPPPGRVYAEAGTRDYIRRYILSETIPLAIDIAELTEELGCPVLAGGSSITFDPTGGEIVIYNTAFWFEGSMFPRETYAKCRLVPFSEYIPMRESCRPVYDWIRQFVPRGFRNTQPGRRMTRFTLTRPTGQWTIVAPICYEGAFADHCRRLVYSNGRRQADVLVNLSNDGWFTWRDEDGGPYRLSAEHAQHLTNYVFRAVENRVPVVRAVNTGISAAIDSNGRVLQLLGGQGGSWLPGTPVASGVLYAGKKDGNGSWKNGLLVDARTSIYSQIGDVFVYGLSAIAIGSVVYRRWRAMAGAREYHD